MKIRKLLCLSLLAMSANVLAMEGNGFRIVSEKMTSTPGFDAHFESVETPSSLKKIMSPKYVNAMSWAFDARGHVREYIKVQGDHNVSITNNTSKVSRYTYTYTLYCESAYASFERTIDINPQGTFTDASHSYGTVQKDNSGTFGIHVGTKIDGGEYAFHQRDATLTITK